MYQKLFFILILAAILSPRVAFPQTDSEEDTSPYSSAVLVSEVDHVQPGTPFTIALRMLMDPGWHSYWQNPGDSGEPTDIVWDLPSGFSTSSISWPYPHRIDLGPLRSYGYSDEVLLLTEITPPANLETNGELQIHAVAYWLICEEICLPAEEVVSITLPVRSSEPSLSQHSGQIEDTRSKLPQSIEGWTIEATSNSGSFVLQVTPPEGESPDFEGAYFFSSAYETIDHPAPQPITKEGDTYLIALQESEYASGTTERLEGVLVASEGSSWDADSYAPALHIDTPITAAAFAASPSNSSTVSLIWMLILAFAGGLLLNLMPCVFPVLSLKILGFAQKGNQAPGATRRQGYSFGLGVVSSFWILAALLLGLRAAGSQIGWGFQLQSPLFVAGMALLFFGIGLNLLGVFEIGSGLMRFGAQSKAATDNHLQRSFFDGVLATLVATPCTAPFMGAALGAAIVLPALQAFLIFTVLGLGMAAPYIVLSMTPSLTRKLPRPGPWMEVLKHVLAFPMLATTVWLVWVFGRADRRGWPHVAAIGHSIARTHALDFRPMAEYPDKPEDSGYHAKCCDPRVASCFKRCIYGNDVSGVANANRRFNFKLASLLYRAC